MGNLKLTSSDFEDGGEIPLKCGYKHGNKEPALAVTGIPEKAETLVLIMDDPDAIEAVGHVWLHWLEWDIIPEKEDYMGLKENSPSFPFSERIIGVNHFGETGYGGPAPPDKIHTYVFKVYALDCELEPTLDMTEDGTLIESKTGPRLGGFAYKSGKRITKADVEKEMEGHIIEQTQLTGTYAP